MLLSLSEEQEDYLSYLEKGQCIVRVNSIKKPFLLCIPYIERHWLKRGEVNRKNKQILKKFKDNDIKILKSTEFSNSKTDKSEKICQVKKQDYNVEEDLSEAAEIKFFIDNLLMGEDNMKKDFNPENYRKCPECYSIFESRYKNCPYCGSSLK